MPYLDETNNPHMNDIRVATHHLCMEMTIQIGFVAADILLLMVLRSLLYEQRDAVQLSVVPEELNPHLVYDLMTTYKKDCEMSLVGLYSIGTTLCLDNSWPLRTDDEV